NKYFDMGEMGVGSCVQGYSNDEIDAAAKRAIDNGGMCSLNAPEEVEVAKEGAKNTIYFNLQGQRVNEPKKGEIYIKDGKKIIK
ncbi:MAG: hypothetical protein J5735_01555, partial [Prevotella sp.]|nr:hypothetical protein [Prevotella sp.]